MLVIQWWECKNTIYNLFKMETTGLYFLWFGIFANEEIQEIKYWKTDTMHEILHFQVNQEMIDNEVLNGSGWSDSSHHWGLN